MLKFSPKSSISKAKSRARDGHVPSVARYTNSRNLRSLYSMVPASKAATLTSSATVIGAAEPSRVWNCNKPKKTANNPYNVYSKQRKKLSSNEGSQLTIREWVHPPNPVNRLKEDNKKRDRSNNYEFFYVPYDQEDPTSTQKNELSEETRSRSFQRLPTAGVRYALKIAKMASLIEEVKSRPMADNDGELKYVENGPLLLPPPQFAENPVESGKRFLLLRSRTEVRFSNFDCDKLLYKYACLLPFVRDPSQPGVRRPKMKLLSSGRSAEHISIEGNMCTT
ncbi:uncharacterized protein LOC113564627 [Drosophila erecta]|uniref:uncharacterized protein LOC113564627 n=1 Tax=Drosophila erecta TaxID=7220 RepID=UPI000F060C4E|nr:uncharacterized protein LOC113564627 [Drosophila erecta]